MLRRFQFVPTLELALSIESHAGMFGVYNMHVGTRLVNRIAFDVNRLCKFPANRGEIMRTNFYAFRGNLLNKNMCTYVQCVRRSHAARDFQKGIYLCPPNTPATTAPLYAFPKQSHYTIYRLLTSLRCLRTFVAWHIQY